MVLRNLIPQMVKELLCKNPKRKDTARSLLNTGTNANLPHAGFTFALHLVHTLKSFRDYCVPDIVLVNITNTTLKAFSSKRSLSRKKKKCTPQNKWEERMHF